MGKEGITKDQKGLSDKWNPMGTRGTNSSMCNTECQGSHLILYLEKEVHIKHKNSRREGIINTTLCVEKEGGSMEGLTYLTNCEIWQRQKWYNTQTLKIGSKKGRARACGSCLYSKLLRRLKQEDHKVKICLIYRVNSKPFDWTLCESVSE